MAFGKMNPRRLSVEPFEQRLCFSAGFLSIGSSTAALEAPLTNSVAIAEGESSDSRFSVQSASVADRVIDSSGYAEFKNATAVPSISPSLPLATSNDLVVQYSDLLGSPTTAVVRKPIPKPGIYQIPTPGNDEEAFDFLRQHLDQATDQDVGTILFPANHIFELTPPDPNGNDDVGPLFQNAHLSLAGLQDVTIDLNGSTLLFTQTTLGIRITDSQRVVLRNGRLEGQALLSSIAKVMPDDNQAGIRFEVLSPYRQRLDDLPPSDVKLFTVGTAQQSTDGQWRLKADGYSELFTNRGKPHNNFVYQEGSFVAQSGLLRDINPYQAGEDYVWLLHQNNNAHAILLDHTSLIEDFSIEDLVFSNIAGMAIAGELDRGLHLNRIQIAPDDESVGFLGVSSDGVHINANGGDIVIENSRFGPNGDDKITIKGNYWKVSEIDWDESTITVSPIDRGASLRSWGSANERVVFIDQDFGVQGNAVLAAEATRVSSNIHTFQLDSIPSGVSVGSYVGNVDASGGRVIIRNNSFRETRAQAILVQTSHVVVSPLDALQIINALSLASVTELDDGDERERSIGQDIAPELF